MRKIVLAILLLASAGPGLAAGKLRFWNLTTFTIAELRLAPPGTEAWGANQCENDPDKAVDSDERLALAGIEPGRYDVKLADRKGRTCLVRNVEIVAGRPYAFSISDKDLTECRP
jgi:hypothetical protein